VGPITLFDKSFIQSLSVDESVWFDHFFLTNVCPLFYVETLADLEKPVRQGRTPEREVAIIADKFPEMHGAPNAFHSDLCIGNLLGEAVPMSGQIPVAGGKLVDSEGERGVVYEESPEAESFFRWQKQEFGEIERRYARVWREALSGLDLKNAAKSLRSLGVEFESCKTLEQAKTMAEQIVRGKSDSFGQMNLILTFLNIPRELSHRILGRWSTAKSPGLVEYAPYAAYVLSVEIFFLLALKSHLISSDRPSNRVDMAYLFYLPFCMMFVSADKLHRLCAPLFLRSDQAFVWGKDLKAGLRELNEYYSRLPVAEKEKGIFSFAAEPPKEGEFFVAEIWDRHFPGWREPRSAEPSSKKLDDLRLRERINKMADAPELRPHELASDPPTETRHLVVRRTIRKVRGSWHQVPRRSA